MNNSKYHICIWGESEGSEIKNGDVLVFDNKSDLTAWLNDNKVTEHRNQALAGRCLLETPDGRTLLIVKGISKIIRKKVFVR